MTSGPTTDESLLEPVSITNVKAPKDYHGPFDEISAAKYEIYEEAPETFVFEIRAVLTDARWTAADPATGRVNIDQLRAYLTKILKGQAVKADECYTSF
jgi:hypothetical protein